MSAFLIAAALAAPPSPADTPFVRVRHLRGVSESIDGGRAWRHAETDPDTRDAAVAALLSRTSRWR